MRHLLPLIAMSVASSGWAGFTPKADSKAVVVCGDARFTVLTDRLIRMEYAPEGAFEDRASLTFVNRELSVPEFTSRSEGKGCVIETKGLSLTYAGGGFTRDSLRVSSRAKAPAAGAFDWRYGDKDAGNLYGTCRTLDGVDSWARGVRKLEKGVLSRDGWAVVDDSKRHVFEPTGDHWGDWVAERTPAKGAKDLYFFGYGHDYKAALGDYVKVAGRIPLPPRWAFGYWWCRYWQYSDDEIRDLVEAYRTMGLGMDVMIIDMDWHDTWGLAAGAAKDEFGESVGWTGYTWKKELFPNPSNLMRGLHDCGLKVGLNIHPASGVQPYEACYGDFVKDYGWQETPKPVPFKISERKWADSWFKTVLGPKEAEGVDFWWMDWQQWLTSKYVKDLSITFWLNHTMAHHMAEKDGKRPFIYHRWGGLGSHRYQTGFSGDTVANWDVLGFEAWFTATSGNVGYGYWGHDLGGHGLTDEEQKAGRPDGEKYLRWMQYGVFSPTFKTHCAKELASERRPWMFPEHFAALRETFRLRYALAPYIYTAARAAYDTGISICRPMYWDWPEEDEAYAPKRAEYMFGPDILVAPVWHPADPETGVAPYEAWLPKGDWYEVASGEILAGGRVLARTAGIEDHPWFVRAGAVIPMYPKTTMNLAETPDEIELFVAPGAASGETTIYEDDGTGADYATQFATRKVSWQAAADGRSLQLFVNPREGKFAGMKDRATWTIRLPGTLAPETVVCNGKVCGYDRFAKDGAWTYDGSAMETVIRLGSWPADKERLTVNVAFGRSLAEMAEATSGKKGLFARLKKMSQEYKISYGETVHPWAMQPDEFLRVSQTASAVTEAPAEAAALIERFDRELKTFIPTLVAKRKLAFAFAKRLAGQLGQAVPEALAQERFTQRIGEGLSVASSSETAKYEVRRVDDRHLILTCSERVTATVTMPLFSGFVRCYPLVGGKRVNELVLTKGVGRDPITAIMLAPCYGATEFEIETCVPYNRDGAFDKVGAGSVE